VQLFKKQHAVACGCAVMCGDLLCVICCSSCGCSKRVGVPNIRVYEETTLAAANKLEADRQRIDEQVRLQVSSFCAFVRRRIGMKSSRQRSDEQVTQGAAPTAVSSICRHIAGAYSCILLRRGMVVSGCIKRCSVCRCARQMHLLGQASISALPQLQA
jgi:hypothetical protein